MFSPAARAVAAAAAAAVRAERDRYRTAWLSARFRAQAYGEGIERVVEDREAYQGWLREAQEALGRMDRSRPTNHAYEAACAALWKHRDRADDAEAERDELRQQASAVSEFVAQRAEYITAINNCHPDNAAGYDRWQGHAEARRQLAEQLDLRVAWPAEDDQGATS
ncbi:hypothetical protein [Streptomyces lasiicapitis]|uniref:hypothetical protein n=1 Tax=Streptomyces lasiicapitis TaxID=1923961 RepID=UPI00369C3492